MLVPLNTAKRSDLALSIITNKEGYSVLIVSIIKGFGMDSLPSYMGDYPAGDDNLFDPCVCVDDYPAVTGPDLYKCIEECMKQIEDLMVE